MYSEDSIDILICLVHHTIRILNCSILRVNYYKVWRVSRDTDVIHDLGVAEIVIARNYEHAQNQRL